MYMPYSIQINISLITPRSIIIINIGAEKACALYADLCFHACPTIISL